MPRQATVEQLQDFAPSDAEALPEADYDAEYQTLDLLPGASLWEIQDRVRLLSTAFDPDGLPGTLGVEAAKRAQRIGSAADLLSCYWQTHGAPPPSAQAVHPGAERRNKGGDRLAGFSGFSFVPAVGPPMAVPSLRPPVAMEAAPSPSRAAYAVEENGGKRSAPPPAAAAPPSRSKTREPQQRRRLAVAGSVLLKAALVGLVVAAAVRVQQYRTSHPALSPYSEPSRAIAPGLPAAPPVRWAGITVAGRRMVGAAAPAIAGHRRQD